tara:strand:- start:21764 stop:23194 length:1431 start_codon:yes stop_codon:yes gene_type:complete
MSIKKYYSTSDTTITNAYKDDLQTRATASNMGLSDSLETFVIYNQVSYSGSGATVVTGAQTEAARILIKFDDTNIKSDYTAETVPSGASFFLRLHNAKHPLTLPKNYTLEVHPLSVAFNEGYGLDMESYVDEDEANWMSASSGVSWTVSGAMSDVGAQLGTSTFTYGDEDLLMDITQHVYNIRDSSITHNGFVVTFPTSSLTDERSYYTKKFFARDTQYYYKQPSIEARWDDSKSDDSGKLFKISSRLNNSDNNNTVFLYNRYNGALQHLGGNPAIAVKFFNDEDRTLELSGSTVSGSVTASSTGIYEASVRVDTGYEHVYTRWYLSGSDQSTIYYENKLAVEPRDFSNDYGEPEYVVAIPNLKSNYSNDESTRLRLHSRLKDWSPTIYTVASKEIENQIVTNAYYKVVRLVDDLDVISYGTGSVEYTKLSYDVSGSYFDFDLSLLEEGYAYGFKILFKINGKYREQPETFKFRVD